MNNYAAMAVELEAKWREVFEKAQSYAALKNVDSGFAEERLGELFDLLVTAQAEGSSVKKITGGDTARFCKDFFSDYTAAERIKAIPKVLMRMACIVFVIELITGLTECNSPPELWDMRSNVGGYLIGLGIGVVYELINIFIITPRMLKNRGVMKWNNFSLAVFIVLFTGSIAASVKLDLFSAVKATSAVLIIVSGAYILCYLAVRSVWRLKNFGTVFNTRSRLERDIYYRSLNDAYAEEGILKGWKWRYERLSRKGKVTEEDFLDKVKKDAAITKKGNYVIWATYAVCYTVAVVKVAFESGVIDSLVFAAVLAAVLWVLHRLFIRNFFIAEANMQRLIAECEKSGETLPCFIERKMITEEDISE